MRFELESLAGPSSLRQIPLDAIDEDPTQPRQEFDPVALGELAETIRERGVLQPVSVRRHAASPDRYVLNFGARRLRASKLAGKPSIPAFVDEPVTSYDQVIENEQREGLTPLELALFVQRRMGAGDSQAEIARRLGKSRSSITYATALIDAPEWLLALYREGRCRSLRELYELRQLRKSSPEAALGSETSAEPITRKTVAQARSGSIATGSSIPRATNGRRTDDPADQPLSGPQHVGELDASRSTAKPSSTSTVQGNTFVLLADLEGRTVEVVLTEAPSSQGVAVEGRLFVRRLGAPDRQVVSAQDLRLIGLRPRS